MTKLIMGPAKDKGGSMSVRQVVYQTTEPWIIEALTGLVGGEGASSMGFNPATAVRMVDKSIAELLSCPDWLLRFPRQDLMRVLVEVRGAAVEAVNSEYEEFGMEWIE